MQADANYKFASLDVPMLQHLRGNWATIRQRLAGDNASQYDIFDGHHFNHQKFERFLRGRGLDRVWPLTPKSGIRCTDEDTWEEMWALDPEIEKVYQMFRTVTMPHLNVACALMVGIESGLGPLAQLLPETRPPDATEVRISSAWATSS